MIVFIISSKTTVRRSHIGKQQRPISFYYLQTSPGHPFCLKDSAGPLMTEPLENIDQYVALYEMYKKERYDVYSRTEDYRWLEYPRHDDFIEKLFVEQLGGTVVP
eukprot:gene26059-32588_t